MRTCVFLAVACLGLAACGEDRSAVDPSPLTGPPAWWTAREGLGERMDGINVRAGGPCDIVLIVDGGETGRRTFPPRRLAAGETVRLTWAPEEASLGQATGEDLAAGRTESYLAALSFGYPDRGTFLEQGPFWTRPGHGQMARASVLPPAAPEPLEPGREIELAVVAVADLDPGRELRLVPRADGHRVVPDPEGLEPPERARVLRLKMVVRPVGGS